MKQFFKRELQVFNFPIPVWGILVAGLLFLFAIISLVVSYSLKTSSNIAEESGRLITIYDGGNEKTILSQAETVEGVLKEAEIEVESSDTVEPALDTKLIASNYSVNIYRSSPAVVVDGGREVRVVTSAQTGRTIAKDAGIELYDEDLAEISSVSNLWQNGGAVLKVVIDRATPVNLTLYGNNKIVRTQAKTVGEFLKEKGIKISEKDKFSPSKDTKISKDMEIKIWREGKNVVTVDEEIPFEVEKILSNDHEVGYREVKTPGQKGKRTVTYEIEIRDGQEVGRKEIQSIVLEEAKPQVEIIGMKQQAAYYSGNEDIQKIIIDAANRYGVDPNTMLRIANCESTFNPNASNGGMYLGLFQQSAQYWPARAARYGYPGASPFDPVANANVSAQMMAESGTAHWECK